MNKVSSSCYLKHFAQQLVVGDPVEVEFVRLIDGGHYLGDYVHKGVEELLPRKKNRKVKLECNALVCLFAEDTGLEATWSTHPTK